ncbi:MAG: hypothetical protein HQL69_06170 [Magnetococcales bacterium]|nr:hypothetical protein [Magnetococcales bacterium]
MYAFHRFILLSWWRDVPVFQNRYVYYRGAFSSKFIELLLNVGAENLEGAPLMSSLLVQ